MSLSEDEEYIDQVLQNFAEKDRFIEDVLKVLGQMDHKRGLEGKMVMSVEDRHRLINEGSKLIGLFPVKHSYMAGR